MEAQERIPLCFDVAGGSSGGGAYTGPGVALTQMQSMPSDLRLRVRANQLITEGPCVVIQVVTAGPE